MKLALTLEADSVNVQALNMGRIVVDVDGVNLSELINKVSENGYLLRVVDKSDQHATWICPYISRHLSSLNPLLARCRRYSRGER